MTWDQDNIKSLLTFDWIDQIWHIRDERTTLQIEKFWAIVAMVYKKVYFYTDFF